MRSRMALLSTKLSPPVIGDRVLHRPRLYACMDDALLRRVTLVSGDAGFGKTTLLAGFLSTAGKRAVWYRLDPNDSDPGVFVAYVLEGLRPYAHPRQLQAARRSLALVNGWAEAAHVLHPVLDGLTQDLCIVLDDFQLLHGTAEAGIGRLIEGLPRRSRLVIAGRRRPDLPLARWGLEGSLAELGPDDLRFTLDEIRSLLVEMHALPLTEPSLHLLAAKTEGWAAGVTLALHAVQAEGATQATRAIAGLSGSSREIYDYLAQEAFGRQPEEIRRFLLHTAVLSRFDVGLADALLASRVARAAVDHLEASHLFIVALDDERRWYRYHHLFQEFLRRVAADRAPEEVREVHRCAARLWEERGELDEALQHFAEAGEFREAARLLAASGPEMIARGRVESARRWLERIPAPEWAEAPRLYFIRGLCEIMAGDDEAALRILDEARRRLQACGDVDGEAQAIRWLAHPLVWQGHQDELRRLTTDAGARLALFPPAGQARILEITARTAELDGRLREAEALYRQAIAVGLAGADDSAHLEPTRYLARALTTVGRLGEAEAILRNLLARHHRMGWGHEEAHLHLDAAAVMLATGRLDEADRHIAQAAALEAVVPCRVLRGDLIVGRARSSARRGAISQAVQTLREALDPALGIFHRPADRVAAEIELSLLLAAAAPDEARALAAGAVDETRRHGPALQARALLAYGIVTRSEEACVRAAAVCEQMGAGHMRATALLHAAALAGPGPAGEPPRAQAREALGALSDEQWRSVAAEAGAERLSIFDGDAELGGRIARALQELPSGPPALYTLQCLGRFAVMRGDVDLRAHAWPRGSARRLLQYLAAQTRPAHREQVMEALWPEMPARAAANQLRVALSHLRHILEPSLPRRRPSSVVITHGSSLALNTQRVATDLERFRTALRRAERTQGEERRAALQEAVDAYAGDLFEESPYEEWAVEERGRLARQYHEALGALAEAEQTFGRLDLAAAWWQRLLTRDPGAEHACRGLAECFLRLGRTADAVRVFDACFAALAELGAEPSPETLRLRESIPALR